MERPTEVRIGPLTYEVRWEGDEWERSARCLAQTDPRLQIIRMPSNLKPDHMACAFIHEITHGLFYPCELGGEKITEEMACDIAGYMLVDFWRDNPDVFDWYIGLVKGGE